MTEQKKMDAQQTARVAPDAYEAFDMADDEQIIAELAGRVVPTYLYQVRDVDGKLVTGLSVAGVNAVCREMGRRREAIRVKASTVQLTLDPTDPEYVIAVIEAERVRVNDDGVEVRLDTTVGVKRQSIMAEPRGKNKRRDKDQFSAEKAISKASRNAKRGLIPESVALQLIQAWLEKNGDAARQLGDTEATPPRTRRSRRRTRVKPLQQPEGGSPQAETKAEPEAEPKAGPKAGKKPESSELAADRQRLWAAMKSVEADEEKCRQMLKDLTGFDSASDMTLEQLKRATAIIGGVRGGQNELHCSGVPARWQITSKADGTTILPEGQSQEEASQAEPPQEEPPPSDDEPMF
jgi:hypothetical protein